MAVGKVEEQLYGRRRRLNKIEKKREREKLTTAMGQSSAGQYLYSKNFSTFEFFMSER